jgi:hypothetical protein
MVNITKYINVKICVIIIYGASAGQLPSQVNKTKVITNVQKQNRLKG